MARSLSIFALLLCMCITSLASAQSGDPFRPQSDAGKEASRLIDERIDQLIPRLSDMVRSEIDRYQREAGASGSDLFEGRADAKSKASGGQETKPEEHSLIGCLNGKGVFKDEQGATYIADAPRRGKEAAARVCRD